MVADIATATPSKGPSPPQSSSSSGRSRRSPQKPQTPRPTRSTTTLPPLPNGLGSSSQQQQQPTPHKSPSIKSETKKRKPIFVSCVNFPESGPAPPPVVKETGDLQRSQRKSKVDAINKLDRAGTPTTPTIASGPAATSFVPPPLPPAGPSVLRNPLKRPRVVNPPFDLHSVRTASPADPGPSTEQPRAFGLPTCPTYRPTMEQFQDPMAYIESIGPEAKRYGICKIVPPEGWQMPFALETDKFRFTTRLQRLNSIEAASRAKINFLEQLSMFHKQQGDTHAFIPRIEHRLLDLWRLRKEVNTLGGVDEVNRLKAWTKITSALGYGPTSTQQVKAAYVRLVLPFEDWALRAKSYPESPLTPAAANGSASGKLATTAPHTPMTPTLAVAAANGRMGGMRPSPRSRMAAANGQAAHGHLSAAVGVDVKLEPGAEMAKSGSLAPPAKIRIKVPGFQTSSHDSDSELSDEESSRASTSQTQSPAEAKYEKGDVCEVCGLGNNAPKILLCDGCDRGFHTFCLDPPLSGIPANEWYCTACLLGNGDDFGFDEGEEHSLPTFQARDAAFTREWFNRYAPTHSVPGPLTRQVGNSSVSEADVEREFWRLVESQEDTVEVEYGADVHSTTHGSAAPTFETNPTDMYSRDPWNLNNMPILHDSLLRYIKSDISGMTVPWIYVGMLFSAFCWHNEDHYTYSINYMFWGETKTWYGIPGADAEKFETAIKKEAPELFERQPALLYQLVTMMNPGRVRDHGVDVFACDQRPNEFVITFPKAYHSGFNHGFNFNEAVNFALPDWLPDGRESVLRYQQHAKPPVFSHAELLITITLYSDTIKTALWLQDSLKEMVKDETESRQRLREAYPDIVETLVEEDVPESQYQCCVCKSFCYLSQVKCDCTTLVVCMDHADMLCDCPKAKRTLRNRFSEDQLQDILDAVVARAAQPEQWQARLESLLSVSRPQLKAVRQLVADGERIPHPLPGLADLRAFLNRANAWLERALAISTRKSTGRRRKGRQSEVAGEDDDVDRSPAAIDALLKEAYKIGFDTLEIAQLQQMVSGMDQFRQEAQRILSLPDEELDYETCNTALILGQSLNIELPEVTQLSQVVSRLRWYHKIEEEVDDQALQYSDIIKLLQEASDNGVPDSHHGVVELRRREETGRAWKEKVDELLASPSISLDAVAALMEGTELIPTSVDLMRQLESIYKTAQSWQQTASTLIATQGSATAAQRLCKAVKSAHGPLSRVEIPEISKLQGELDFTAKWTTRVAKLLSTPVAKLSTSVNNLLRDFEEHLQDDDDTPNGEHACFCRLEPAGTMVTCVSCLGDYHPKCIGITAKSASAVAKAAVGFQCQMCRKMQYDDRPSFHSLALLMDPVKWNFVLRPPEYAVMEQALELSLKFAQLAIPFIESPGPKRDAAQISHLLRKIWTLPVQLDCVNLSTNELFVFDDWLYRRWREATDGGITAGSKAVARTRARKPRFQFVDAFPHEFHCICKTEPLDHLLTVQCAKCEQGFHLSCAKAPITQANAQGRGGWRCPFCVIKMGKPAPRGMDLRVQMEDKRGTDEYIDWRQTLFVYAEEPIPVTLAPNPNALVLICTKFLGPALPEDFEIPVWTEGDTNGRRKKRKTDPAPAPEAVASTAPMPPQGGVASQPLANGAAHPPPVARPQTTQTPSYASAVAGQPPRPSTAQDRNPVQNVRPNGRTYYPTHTVVPWENSDMFNQFSVADKAAQPVDGRLPPRTGPATAAPGLSHASMTAAPRPSTQAQQMPASAAPAPMANRPVQSSTTAARPPASGHPASVLSKPAGHSPAPHGSGAPVSTLLNSAPNSLQHASESPRPAGTNPVPSSAAITAPASSARAPAPPSTATASIAPPSSATPALPDSARQVTSSASPAPLPSPVHQLPPPIATPAPQVTAQPRPVPATLPATSAPTAISSLLASPPKTSDSPSLIPLKREASDAALLPEPLAKRPSPLPPTQALPPAPPVAKSPPRA